MTTFRDQNGKEWQVKVDAPTIHEVRKELAVDLARLDEDTFSGLVNDPCLLVDVLWLVCRRNANGVTDRQFGESICGDALDHATKALLDAIADFFPARKRSLLRSLGEQNAAMMDRLQTAMETKLADPTLMAEIEAAMLKSLDERLQNTLTRLTLPMNAPESSESRPTD